MKRKLLIFTLAAAMLCTTGLSALAADGTDRQTTTLSTSKTSTYTLTIPASQKAITFGAETTELGSLQVTGDVNVGQYVTVSVNNTALQRAGNISDTIDFTLMNTSSNPASEYKTGTWDEPELRAGQKAIPLSVHIAKSAWDSAKAGSYSGTIEFVASLQDPVKE